jgi:hypothetical protein
MSKDQLVALFNKKEEIKIRHAQNRQDVTQSVLKKMAAVTNPKKESILNIDNLKNGFPIRSTDELKRPSH